MTTGLDNALALNRCIGFVVLGERNCLPIAAENSTAVTSIGYYYGICGDATDNCSAANMVGVTRFARHEARVCHRLELL